MKEEKVAPVNEDGVLVMAQYEKNNTPVTISIRVDHEVYWSLSERAATAQSDEPWLTVLARLLEIPEIKDGRLLPILCSDQRLK